MIQFNLNFLLFVFLLATIDDSVEVQADIVTELFESIQACGANAACLEKFSLELEQCIQKKSAEHTRIDADAVSELENVKMLGECILAVGDTEWTEPMHQFPTEFLQSIDEEYPVQYLHQVDTTAVFKILPNGIEWQGGFLFVPEFKEAFQQSVQSGVISRVIIKTTKATRTDDLIELVEWLKQFKLEIHIASVRD